MQLPAILQLSPEYRNYVWGGDRLRPGHSPTAEAWVIYENDRVSNGPLEGWTLAEVTEQYGPLLLGQEAHHQTGLRFPILVKLLDCAQWLSLQVHPDDKQAVELEGPGFFGKTEAWHILEAVPGAQIIAGLKPDTVPEILRAAIRNGTIMDWVQYHTVHAGDTISMRPGTIHALGPGLLIYEIQQTSDLTYRVYDWSRPQTDTRKLHIEKSLHVVRPDIITKTEPLPPLTDGSEHLLCQSSYFRLEIIASANNGIEVDTHGESFHALTVIEGSLQIYAGEEVTTLDQFESALLPAAVGIYQIRPLRPSKVLKASA